MGLQFNPAPKAEGSKDMHIRAHYNVEKRRWYAKFGKEQHPIAMASLEISGAKILYSLPQNEEHEPWTIKHITTIQDPFKVSKWWSVLCEGVAILGKPNKKDGTYVITKILHTNIKRKGYTEDGKGQTT